MESLIAGKLGLAYGPVAILWSDEKPEGALQLKPHASSCIMYLFAQVVTRGKTAVFDRETYGCPGAGPGSGSGTATPTPSGGPVSISWPHSSAKGSRARRDPGAYTSVVGHMPERERAKFLRGERLHRSPEKAKRFMTRDLPVTDIAERYVIFTPLSKVKADERPVVVVFVADPLQITGLVTLVGAILEGTDPVRVPPMAACQQIGAFVYEEARREHPRAVLGYTDLAARERVGETIPRNMFTFAVPLRLFEEMEEEARDGVFDGPVWLGLAEGCRERAG